MNLPSNALRRIVVDTAGTLASDGAGVRLRRLLGGPGSPSLDPFLMLDHFDSDRPDDYIAGFPAHPHRGFQTVTYMLDGRLSHRDNKGHTGLIEAGGVQWMNAGRGIVHSEMPEQRDGLMRGFQLWVNLPARLKMSEPGYQEFPPSRMPVETRPGARVKVVAGRTSTGTAGPVTAEATDARFLDVTLEPGASFHEPLPEGHATFVVVHGGALRLDDRSLEPVRMAVLSEEGDVRAQAGPAGARFLLVAGRPLREPVVWHGPFVMNTEAEIRQAVADFQAGRF